MPVYCTPVSYVVLIHLFVFTLHQFDLILGVWDLSVNSFATAPTWRRRDLLRRCILRATSGATKGYLVPDPLGLFAYLD